MLFFFLRRWVILIGEHWYIALQCEVHMPKVHEYSSAWRDKKYISFFPLMKQQCKLPSSSGNNILYATAEWQTISNIFLIVKMRENHFKQQNVFHFSFRVYMSELDSNWRKCVLAFILLCTYKCCYVRYSHFSSLCIYAMNFASISAKGYPQKTDTTTAAIATGDHVDLIFHLFCTRTFVQSVSLFWFDRRENHLWNWDEEKARALSRKVNVCIHIHCTQTESESKRCGKRELKKEIQSHMNIYRYDALCIWRESVLYFTLARICIVYYMHTKATTMTTTTKTAPPTTTTTMTTNTTMMTVCLS